ncbi:DUF4179 domain-containing protein [Paenibacillus sp. QZ-Y1]|uniref:DUF4179 domain-containing protein n=1 Tax=Paenibacillus sp. QZ-Y1 TaxID=3414511 RepID=UPI003F7AED8C
MNRFIENVKSTPKPDYDLMWTAIENEAHNRRDNLQTLQKATRHRGKAIPISVVFSCFLLVAIPVFASVTIDWDRIGGGRTVANALKNGIGQQYDLHSSSSGVTMNLNGVVTDGEKMKMLISLDTPTDLTQYTGFATEINTLTSDNESKAKVYGILGYDPDSQKLVGVYETPDTLKDDTKEYTFEAQNLIFYRDRNIPLKSNHQPGDTMVTGVAQYPTIHIESVRQDGDQTVVRYKVAASPSDLGRGNPHLVVHTGDQELNAIPTILPNKDKDLFIEQVFNMTKKDWTDASIQFSYMEEEKQTGTWKFDFRADGKKASEAIYRKALPTNTEFQEKTGITLEQLAVTPLDIQILIDEEGSLKNGIAHYQTVQLGIGDNIISGDRNLKGDLPGSYQHLFQFESPEWYKSWSNVPMKLILKDAVVEKRDTTTNWTTLNKPKQEKQYTKINVDGLEIQFTYYTEGSSLIVESHSESPGFKGVNQTTLRINGKEVVPEIIPKGMVSKKINIDRYSGIPLNEVIELNPGIYKYADPDRDIEVKL